MICVYVAIDQKQSTIAQVVKKLEESGVRYYSIIVAAIASDPAALQYISSSAVRTSWNRGFLIAQ